MIRCEVCYEIHLLSSLDAIIAFIMTSDGSRERHGSLQADERNAVSCTVRRIKGVKSQEAHDLAVVQESKGHSITVLCDELSHGCRPPTGCVMLHVS